MPRIYTRRPIEERFREKVQKSEGCWLWIGSRDAKGYGGIRAPGRRGELIRAHRLSYEIHVGQIPTGLSVLHHCDNPPCVRPDHLFLGTISDNSRDMASKGRAKYQKYPELAPRGERHAMARLTDSAVSEIRRRYAFGETQVALAALLGVRQTTISNIVLRKNWTHIQ